MEKAVVVNIAKSIKKQIPQKPMNVEKSMYGFSSAECPACGYRFQDIGGAWESYGEVEEYNYCPECGQKIDWEAVRK